MSGLINRISWSEWKIAIQKPTIIFFYYYIQKSWRKSALPDKNHWIQYKFINAPDIAKFLIEIGFIYGNSGDFPYKSPFQTLLMNSFKYLTTKNAWFY